ncbi:MAG TPA: flagellar motor switch protein FliG [Kofleriaceae bacterium]|nr:flagellar motor switch protein FliG [Kofleriaceae bacterium]
MTASHAHLSPAQRAVLVLMSLDEQVAAELLRHMEEADLKRLAAAVEGLDQVSFDAAVPVLEDFERQLQRPQLAGRGARYMLKLTAAAVGAEKAERLFAPVLVTTSPLDAIRAAKANKLAELLQDEHPQVAAIVLSQLPQAGKVLQAMPPALQADLAGRIAMLEEIPPQVLEIASESLQKQLAQSGAMPKEGKTEFDGIAHVALLLNDLPAEASEQVLSSLDEETARKVRQAMFTFEDLLQVDKRSMQTLLREVPGDQLCVALRTASETVRVHFFSCMSGRASESLREDLELMPPKRLSEVEAAQREIVEAALRLGQTGQIQLPNRGGGDEMV